VVKAFDSNVYTLLISNPFVGKSSNLLGVDIFLFFVCVDVVIFACGEVMADADLCKPRCQDCVDLAGWAERRVNGGGTKGGGTKGGGTKGGGTKGGGTKGGGTKGGGTKGGGTKGGGLECMDI
jgi:hypothetical protein